MAKSIRDFKDSENKQRPPGSMEFDDFMLLWEGDIGQLTSRYRWYFREPDAFFGSLPETDDVRQELTLLLYTAWDTWRPDKGDFGKYYWSIVRNKLTDQTRKLSAAQRAATIYPLLVEDAAMAVGAFVVDDLLIISLPVKGLHPRERELWLDLLGGKMDVNTMKRKYGPGIYRKLIMAWRKEIQDATTRDRGQQ